MRVCVGLCVSVCVRVCESVSVLVRVGVCGCVHACECVVARCGAVQFERRQEGGRNKPQEE